MDFDAQADGNFFVNADILQVLHNLSVLQQLADNGQCIIYVPVSEVVLPHRGEVLDSIVLFDELIEAKLEMGKDEPELSREICVVLDFDFRQER